MSSTPSTSRKILVIVPTFNEIENLPALMEKMPMVPGLEMLFIDDHSRDGTPEWIRKLENSRKGIHLLERPEKLGLGTAYIAGFQWALERDYEMIFEMDADLSHDPLEIPRFIQAVDEGADLVVGSRYLHGIRIVNWPLERLILSKMASLYTRFCTGLPLTDPTSGFKCFHRKVLENMALDQIRCNGYGFQIEIDYHAWKMGFRVREIPITFTDRHHGASKMSRQIVFEALWRIPGLRFTPVGKRKS